MRIFQSILIVMAVLIISHLSSSYIVQYFCLLSVLFCVLFSEKEISAKIFCGYLLAYYGIALLNVSTYRGYISLETIKIYVTSVSLMLTPLLILRANKNPYPRDFSPSSLTNSAMVAHLAIAWVALLYVYARFGVIIVNQDLRFGIPTSIGYTIRSVQFLPVYMLVCRNHRSFWLSFTAVTILSLTPTLLIASRATLALVLVAMALYVVVSSSYGWKITAKLKDQALFVSRPRTRMQLLIFAAIFGVFIVIGGFYLRRANAENLMTGSQFVARYFDASNPLSYVIAPLHQGFNETAALTSRIVDESIVNHQSATPLLWADFNNLLGLSRTAAAQFFGDMIGRADAGGLTPGIVGGVLLDFRDTYYIWFLGFGLLLAVGRLFATHSRRALCVYVIFLSQFFHLMHRGFIKPEYLSILAIAIFYMITMKRSGSSADGLDAARQRI